jgi:hypothetical protein
MHMCCETCDFSDTVWLGLSVMLSVCTSQLISFFGNLASKEPFQTQDQGLGQAQHRFRAGVGSGYIEGLRRGPNCQREFWDTKITNELLGGALSHGVT